MNKQDRLQIYTSDAVSKKANTAIEIFKSPNLCFRALANAYDSDSLKKAIHSTIYDAMVLMFPNDDILGQSLLFAEDIVDTRPDWKINDIDLFFKFIRRNQGQEEMKLFGKLSVLWLNQMVVKYEEYKSEAREQQYQQIKEGQFDATQYPAKYIEAIKQVLVDAKPLNESKPVIRNADPMHQQWMRKFDEINKLHPVMIEGYPSRFIYRYHRRMDIIQYMEYKLKQYNRLTITE